MTQSFDPKFTNSGKVTEKEVSDDFKRGLAEGIRIAREMAMPGSIIRTVIEAEARGFQRAIDFLKERGRPAPSDDNCEPVAWAKSEWISCAKWLEERRNS